MFGGESDTVLGIAHHGRVFVMSGIRGVIVGQSCIGATATRVVVAEMVRGGRWVVVVEGRVWNERSFTYEVEVKRVKE